MAAGIKLAAAGSGRKDGEAWRESSTVRPRFVKTAVRADRIEQRLAKIPDDHYSP
jgi:hypothetical protein